MRHVNHWGKYFIVMCSLNLFSLLELNKTLGSTAAPKLKFEK